jgi:hypothetical protein
VTVRSWKTALSACTLALAMLFASATPSFALLDKTRFVAHLGVAYFCFHHWVLRPYEQGAFAPGAPHRVSSIVKGGVALLFAVHEVRVAERIAETSPDPLLHRLNGAVIALAGTFAVVGERFKAGDFNPQDVSNLTGSTGSLSALATAAGTPIQDRPIPVPGL